MIYIQTNNQTNRDHYSSGTQRCQGYKKVTPPVFPHLNDFTGKLIFFIKVDPRILESQNQAQYMPVGLPSSSIKI